MERKLIQSERQYLIKGHRMSSNARVRDSIKAVLAYDDGYSFSEIAKILLLDDETIGRHFNSVPSKADLQKQEDFIEKYNILKSSIKSDEIILFGDSIHPQHQTKLTYGWIKKGVRKSEKMTACQKRINIIGAINLDTHHTEYCKVD